MNRINRASSTHSVRVPLSTTPQPQFGNRTIWNDEGLRLADFQGDIIAADRDAPPGLQVRFSDGEQWIPLGPGEVLWSPRHYSEVHARVWRMGAGIPTSSGYAALPLRGGNGGAVILGPAYANVTALLHASSFSLYNGPIQAFPGSRQGNPGGLFFRASDLNTADTARAVLLGNWFSAADLNAAAGLVVEYEFLAADVAATRFQGSPATATYAPYLQMTMRDPLDSNQQALRVGACESYTALSLTEHGVLRGRFAFSGPFAAWQSLEISDVFNSPAGVRMMGASQGTWSNRTRVSLISGPRPTAWASLLMGRVPVGTPVVATHTLCSLRHQIAGFESIGPRQIGNFSAVFENVTAGGTLYSYIDAFIMAGAATGARARPGVGITAANVSSEFALMEGIIGLYASANAGSSWDNATRGFALRVQELP